MSTNPLINGVKDGLIHPGQLEQSLLGRGHLKRHIAGTRVGHVIKRPLVLPIDSEGRLLDTTADPLLKDSEYMRRRQQLFPVFTVVHNWMTVLDKQVGEVKDDMITLPMPQCRFEFLYENEVHTGQVMQDEETHEIFVWNITDINDEPVTNRNDEFKRHVVCACIALEMELAGKTSEVNKDLKIPSVHSGEYRQIYKILAIKKKSKAPDHNVNTGKTAQRFHIRRSHWKMVKGVRKRIKWYCAGNIELGIIIKDYVIT
jgi:hypothetical protein